MFSHVGAPCVERDPTSLARGVHPSRGASTPREGFWIPREGLAPREGRFVSIGEVHDQTTRTVLTDWPNGIH